jgi:hypothetical protein
VRILHVRADEKGTQDERDQKKDYTNPNQDIGGTGSSITNETKTDGWRGGWRKSRVKKFSLDFRGVQSMTTQIIVFIMMAHVDAASVSKLTGGGQSTT